MTVRSGLVAITGAILVGVGLWFFWPVRIEPRHVFINETSDHRFDESIRVSILAAETRTGIQNAVVISSLRNESGHIERAAAQAFKDLHLGRATSGRAILYYFNPAAQALKIEIGHALEGVIPDITISGLELAAKSFIYADRSQDFWAELINTLNIEIQAKEKGEPSPSDGFDFSKLRYLSGGAGVTSRSYEATSQQLGRERVVAPRDSRLRAGSSPEETLKIYLQSLREGRYEGDADFLTSESGVFREKTPMSSYQLYRNSRMYDRAGVSQIIRDGSLAWVFFNRDHPVLPLVLREEHGQWRVDEPLSWSLFQRFEDSHRVFLKFPLTSGSASLTKFLSHEMGEPLHPLSVPLKTDLFRTKAQLSARFPTSLIRYYDIQRAEIDLQKARLEDLTTDELFFAADIYTNLGHYDSFLKAYTLLAQRLPNREAIQRNWEFYQKRLVMNNREWILERQH